MRTRQSPTGRLKVERLVSCRVVGPLSRQDGIEVGPGRYGCSGGGKWVGFNQEAI